MREDSGIGGGDLTRMEVLAFLGANGPASRATVARELDLSPGLVSQVTRRLIQEGVVRALYFAPSEGGRPGQLLGLAGDAGFAVGVKLAADHLIYVRAQLDGQVTATSTYAFDAMAPDAIPILLDSLGSFLGTNSERLVGVGICVPGVVQQPDEGVVDADVLGWAGMPLGDRVRDKYDVPVLIENDVKAFAVAEHLYGRGRSRKGFIVVTVGRGIGFACVNSGVLLRGARGGAGELAHVVVANNGPVCACGQRGCLESFIGAEGLAQAGRTAGFLSGEEGFGRLTELADQDHAGALEVFAHAGQRLAHALAPAIAALNPEVVIVAGEGTTWWKYWDSSFRSALARRLPGSLRATPVEVDEWDESSWARGAATIVLAALLDRNAHAGQQRLQVLARLHGPGRDRKSYPPRTG